MVGYVSFDKIRRKTNKIKIRTRWVINELIDNLIHKSFSLNCPVCGFIDSSSNFRLYESYCVFGGGKLIRHECPQCGVIFGTQRMLSLSPEDLEKEYAEHYDCYDEGDSTEAELRTFHYLNPKPEGIYLNFGCGQWSKTLEEARKMGYQLFGFDPHAIDSSSEYIISDLDTLKSLKFDGIMSNNLLEHLRYPEKDLLLMASLLKKGCYMVHTTPCYQYSYEYTRFHLYFFTGNSIRFICDKANLEYRDTNDCETKIFYPKQDMRTI
jgi:hypothetical protein